MSLDEQRQVDICAWPKPFEETDTNKGSVASRDNDATTPYEAPPPQPPEIIHSVALYEHVALGPGGRVWDASLVLARYIVNTFSQDELRCLRILEIGAGTGLCGIVSFLHSKGEAEVILTDKSNVLSVLETNAKCILQTHHASGDHHTQPKVHQSEETDISSTPPPKNGPTGDSKDGQRRKKQKVSRRALVQPGLTVDELRWGQNMRRFRGCFDIVLASDVVGCGDESLFPSLIKTLKDATTASSKILLSYKPRAEFEDEFFAMAEEYFHIKKMHESDVSDMRRGDMEAGRAQARYDQQKDPVTVYLLTRRDAESIEVRQ